MSNQRLGVDQLLGAQSAQSLTNKLFSSFFIKSLSLASRVQGTFLLILECF